MMIVPMLIQKGLSNMLTPKIPGMGRVNAAQLLWLDSEIDADEAQIVPEGSGDILLWWNTPFTKPDNYGF